VTDVSASRNRQSFSQKEHRKAVSHISHWETVIASERFQFHSGGLLGKMLESYLKPAAAKISSAQDESLFIEKAGAR